MEDEIRWAPQSDVWVDEEKGQRHFKIAAIDTKNLFAFSASASYSEEMHQRWREKEGYDACYRIYSARLFFKALTKALPNAEFIHFDYVHYFDEQNSNNIMKGKIHPALVKTKNGFDIQNEVRAIWKPTPVDRPIQPIILEKTKAALYCEPYKVLA